jgi:hypothetical protein
MPISSVLYRLDGEKGNLMSSRFTRHLAVAMSLSLSVLAGCAAPATAPLPIDTSSAQAPAAPVTTPAAGEAPAVTTPAVPGQAAPTAPAAAVLSAQGAATFNGEPLAGYTVRAFNALTGAEIALGAAVATDAQGRFQAALPGVTAGQLVRLVATQAHVTVEATYYAGRTPEAGLALTATSTYMSQVAAGPLAVAGTLAADKAAPVADAYMTALAGIEAGVGAEISRQNALAGMLVRTPATASEAAEVDAAYERVLTNINAMQTIMDASADLVQKVAAADAAPAAAFAVLATTPGIRRIRFRGTQLQADIGSPDAGAPSTGSNPKPKLQLTNVFSGKSVEAGSGDLKTVSRVQRSSSSSRRSSAVVGLSPTLLASFVVPPTGTVALPVYLPLGPSLMPYTVYFADSTNGTWKLVECQLNNNNNVVADGNGRPVVVVSREDVGMPGDFMAPVTASAEYTISPEGQITGVAPTGAEPFSDAAPVTPEPDATNFPTATSQVGVTFQAPFFIGIGYVMIPCRAEFFIDGQGIVGVKRISPFDQTLVGRPTDMSAFI